MKITDFITNPVIYDSYGQYLWIQKPEGLQMLATIRGWGGIQQMFIGNDGTLRTKEASQYQDQIGNWIAEAINEKLEREKNNCSDN